MPAQVKPVADEAKQVLQARYRNKIIEVFEMMFGPRVIYVMKAAESLLPNVHTNKYHALQEAKDYVDEKYYPDKTKVAIEG